MSENGGGCLNVDRESGNVDNTLYLEDGVCILARRTAAIYNITSQLREPQWERQAEMKY